MARGHYTSEYSKMLGFHFDSRLANNLMYWRNMTLQHDADCAIVVDGIEGVGKSVMAQQIAAFLDKDNKIDLDTQIHFSHEDVIKAARTLPKGKAIIYDEASESMDVSLGGTKLHRQMKRLFQEVRQRNLFFILVLPSIYSLQRFFAIWRTRALVHVRWVKNEKELKFDRGYFDFFNERGKNYLYTTDNLRKHYIYKRKQKSHILSTFSGRFFDHYVCDKEAYKKKKEKFSVSLNEDDDVYEFRTNPRMVAGALLTWLDKNKWLKHGWKSALVEQQGCDRKTIYNSMGNKGELPIIWGRDKDIGNWESMYNNEVEGV